MRVSTNAVRVVRKFMNEQLVRDKKDFLLENIHRILRWQLVIKFRNSSMVQDCGVCNETISEFYRMVDDDDVLGALKQSLRRITAEMMSKVGSLRGGLLNMVDLMALLDDHETSLEVVLRIKRLIESDKIEEVILGGD